MKLNQNDRLGEQRQVELLGQTAPASAAEGVNRLEQALDGCLERPDDVTVIAIGRERRGLRSRHSSRNCAWKVPQWYRLSR